MSQMATACTSLILLPVGQGDGVIAHSPAHPDEAEIDTIVGAEHATRGGRLPRVEHRGQLVFGLRRNQRTAGRARRRAGHRL